MPASAEIKIGVVNFQKLMEEAPQVKSCDAGAAERVRPRRRELVTMQNDLKAATRNCRRSARSWRRRIAPRPRKSLRDQQREFSRKGGEFQDDASTRANEEIGKVQRYLVQEIQTYCERPGL